MLQYLRFPSPVSAHDVLLNRFRYDAIDGDVRIWDWFWMLDDQSANTYQLFAMNHAESPELTAGKLKALGLHISSSGKQR